MSKLNILESFIDRHCYCLAVNAGEFPIGMLVGMARRSDEAFFFTYTDAEIASALYEVKGGYDYIPASPPKMEESNMVPGGTK